MKKCQLKWRISSNNEELDQLLKQMILNIFLISFQETSGLFLCKIVLLIPMHKRKQDKISKLSPTKQAHPNAK